MADKKYFLLKVDGIEGEETDPNYPGYFQVYNWSWDMFMTQTMQAGGGMASGKASLSTFGFDKQTDKSSPLLAQSCASGAHIKEALLVARKQGQESGELEEFVKYTFSDLVVVGFKLNGIGEGGSVPSERIEIAFAKVRIDYEEKKLGKAEGWIGAEFDSKTNKVA